MTERTELEASAEGARQAAEVALARSMFTGGLTVSAIVDKTAAWLLVGIGATLALIVANLEPISSVIGPTAVRRVMQMLLVAGLFGILERYLAVLVGTQLQVDSNLRSEMPPILGKYNEARRRIQEFAAKHRVDIQTREIDIMWVMGELRSIIPWWRRRFAQRMLERNIEDPLILYKRAGKMLNRQVAYAVVQLLLVIAAVFYVAMSVGVGYV